MQITSSQSRNHIVRFTSSTQTVELNYFHTYAVGIRVANGDCMRHELHAFIRECVLFLPTGTSLRGFEGFNGDIIISVML